MFVFESTSAGSASHVETSTAQRQRPSIVITDRQLRDVSDEAVRALIAFNSPPQIFQRGGTLVRLKVDHRGPAIQTMSDAALRGRLARVADWYRLDAWDGRVGVNPPSPIVQDILALPEIAGIP